MFDPSNIIHLASFSSYTSILEVFKLRIHFRNAIVVFPAGIFIDRMGNRSKFCLSKGHLVLILTVLYTTAQSAI